MKEGWEGEGTSVQSPLLLCGSEELSRQIIAVFNFLVTV